MSVQRLSGGSAEAAAGYPEDEGIRVYFAGDEGVFFLFEERILDPERAVKYVERKIRRIEGQIDELTAVKGKLREIVDRPADEICPIDDVLQAMNC